MKFSLKTTSLSRFKADLNSSLARSAGECYPYRDGSVPTQIGVCGCRNFTSLFFIHNFGYRYARKPFKGSKDVDFCLVSETNLSQKDGSIVWCPGPGKGGQKNPKTPPPVTFPQQTPNQQQKNFFSMSTRRLTESVEGLNSSLALAADDLWPKKGEPIYWLGFKEF